MSSAAEVSTILVIILVAKEPYVFCQNKIVKHPFDLWVCKI